MLPSYKMGDKKQLKQIYEHFGNTVEEDEFMDMYKYATSKPYGFVYIDTDPKEECCLLYTSDAADE